MNGIYSNYPSPPLASPHHTTPHHTSFCSDID